MQSIINKVRSRVSSILPNSLAKWFSPSHGTNGNLRRRRDSDSEEEEEDDEEEEDEENNIDKSRQHKYKAPPIKRVKVSEVSCKYFSSFFFFLLIYDV